MRPTVLMLLTNAYGPDPRVRAEAHTLADQGYDVRIICWDRDGQRPRLETNGPVSVERIRVRSTHRRGIAQVVPLAAYWRAAMLRAARGGRRIHAVHAHDFDTWPAGWAIARLLRVPLVLDAHESFSDLMRGHLPGPACAAIRWMEDRLLPRADAVVTVGERLAAMLTGRGAKRVCVLPNSKSVERFHASEPERVAYRRAWRAREDQWVLGYISHLGPERPVPAMIEAVGSDPRVVWVVGGDGHFADAVAEAAKRSTNIVYLGRVPPEDVAKLTACFDAVFCGFDPDNPNARFSAPNKLFEALAAGKPLLTGQYGEIGEIVMRHGCGVAVGRFTPPLLRAGLNELADPRMRAMAGDRSAALGRTLDWSVVRHRLVDLYAELLAAGPHPISNPPPAPSSRAGPMRPGERRSSDRSSHPGHRPAAQAAPPAGAPSI